jgi:hypothetical protein
MMKPIIFSTKLIKKILAGEKTQTRRVMKPQPTSEPEPARWHPPTQYAINFCPYGKPGDQLWVRETWGTEVRYGHMKPSALPPGCKIYYRTEGDGQYGLDQWRPSIFMPRWASRITLTIKKIRIERVMDITEQDIKDEGVSGSFPELWDKIYAKRGYPWRNNPWVWVIEF